MSFLSEISSLIEGFVGNNRENKPDDVMHVKSVLHELGYFDSTKEPEPHGYITREMDDGIKRYQKDRGLRVDGWMKPGGETELAMLKDLHMVSDDIEKEQLSEPTIPGTNIPDRGVPEDYMTPEWLKKKMDEFRYSLDKNMEKNNDTEKKSYSINPEIDPDILLQYDSDNPWIYKRKYWDL